MTEFSKRLLCVATFWLLSFSQASSTNNKEPKKVIIYARLNISKGMMIGDAEIQEKVIFARKTPPNTVACRKDAIGHYATCAIKTGQVILTSYLKSDRPGYKQTRPTHGNCTKLTFVRAKVAIPAGSVIRRGDLETFTVGVDAAEPGWLSEAEVIVGRRAKVSIIAGRILTYDLIDTNKQFAGSREKAR